MHFDEKTQCFVVESPVSVLVGKKKFMLNLNPYRNAHFQVLNRAKDEYKRIMHNEIIGLPHMMKRISVDYEIIFGDKRVHDGMNIIAVLSKFFLDALVAYGKIKDDNKNIVIHEEWNDGGFDKNNTKVLIYIKVL